MRLNMQFLKVIFVSGFKGLNHLILKSAGLLCGRLIYCIVSFVLVPTFLQESVVSSNRESLSAHLGLRNVSQE